MVQLADSNVHNPFHPCAIHTVIQKISEQTMSSREFLPGSSRYNSLSPTLSDLIMQVLDRDEQNELLSQGAHNPPKAAEKASVAGYDYLLNF